MSPPGPFGRNHTLVALLLSLLLTGEGPAAPVPPRPARTQVSIYASGFVNPKGLAFAADGSLYVAESGRPGEVFVPLPVNFGGEGPIGSHGRISKVPPGGGRRVDFAAGLSNIGLYGGVEMLGPSGLAHLGGQLYEVAAGHMTVSPRLSRVGGDGRLTAVADLGAFNRRNPATAGNGDAIPMGNPYDVVAMGDALYITDGNYNRVIKATPDGELSLLAQWDNSPVTVGAAAGPDGNLYVCQFSPAPYYSGSGQVDRVAPDGKITEAVAADLTTPIDVAFGPDGAMYVLQYAAEFSPQKLRYIPFGGEVRRVEPGGGSVPVVTNLVFPTALAFGPDGALYVSNFGNEANEGQGHVLRVEPGEEPARGPDVAPPEEGRTYALGSRKARQVDLSGTKVAAKITIVEPNDALKWGYEPTRVTIRAGEAITVTNGGKIAHSATHLRGAFDSGLLSQGESMSFRMDDPGVYDLFCIPHPWMKGRVTVEGDARVAPAPAPAEADEPPPTVGPWRAVSLVGLMIAGVYATGFALRGGRGNDPDPTPRWAMTSPSPREGDDDERARRGG